MIQVTLEGLALGLSAGVYCLGTCLIFFMPYLMVEGKRRASENLLRVLLFMLGRLIAYIGFALGMGFLGVKYQGVLSAKISYLSLVIASSLMFIYALTHNLSAYRFCQPLLRRSGFMRIPFFLGFFSGLNPCLPFLAGAARLWTLKSIFLGAIMFFAFFLGTSLYMVPLIFISYLNRVERVKQIGIMAALLSSLWFLFVGVSGLIK